MLRASLYRKAKGKVWKGIGANMRVLAGMCVCARALERLRAHVRAFGFVIWQSAFGSHH